MIGPPFSPAMAFHTNIQGSESGSVTANVSSPAALSFGPIEPQRPFSDDYPAENALVTFK
jgi:hypothetical protein